jgi:hypothetical protein
MSSSALCDLHYDKLNNSLVERRVIAGRDFAKYPKPVLYAWHEDTVNLGVHRLHTGGRFSSWLQVPITR